MTYYIVVNEWSYPTEFGRELVGDYSTLEDADKAAEREYENERDNFIDVNGETYEAACGHFRDWNGEEGYMLHSSQYEDEDMFFRSVIIKREIN